MKPSLLLLKPVIFNLTESQPGKIVELEMRKVSDERHSCLLIKPVSGEMG